MRSVRALATKLKKRPLIMAVAGFSAATAVCLLLYHLLGTKDSQTDLQMFGIHHGRSGSEQERGAGAHDPGRFGPPYSAGNSIAYRFSTLADADIDFAMLLPNVNSGAQRADSTMTQVRMRAGGDLLLKFYEAGAGSASWDVAAMGRDVRYTLNDQVPSYAVALDFPFVFRMDGNGLCTAFRFPKGMPDDAKLFLKQLVYGLQVVFPGTRSKEWETTEEDTTGQYQARYLVEGADKDAKRAVVRKEKVRYLRTFAAESKINALMGSSQTRIAKSDAVITFSLASGRILDLGSQEDLVSLSGSRQWAKSSCRFEVHSIDEDVSAAFPALFSEFVARMESPKYVREGLFATDPLLDKLGAGLDMEGALVAFDRMRNSTKPNERELAERFLVDYLRTHPEASAELLGILDADEQDGRYDRETQLMLWRLVTEAGTPDAQRAVVDCIANPSYTMTSHIRGLMYVGEFLYPEPFLVDKLWELYRHPEMSGNEEDTGDVKNMSILAIGSLGYRDRLNDAIKPVVEEALLANLAGSTDARDMALSLEAMGNLGNPAVLDRVTPYFSYASEEVRSAAYDSLRRMEDPAAVSLLDQHFKKETSENVRVAALKVLAGMPPSRASVSWARDNLPSLRRPEEQAPVIQLLGDTISQYPENEVALRNLLKSDPSREVKKAIYRYIQPE